MEEIWKDIKGYEGLYQVSNLGSVRSLDKYVNSAIKYNSKVKRKGRILKQTLKTNGYLQVALIHNNNRKYIGIHRLVAQAFIPNPNCLPQAEFTIKLHLEKDIFLGLKAKN